MRVENRRDEDVSEKKAEDVGWECFFCLKLEVWWDEHV